MRFTILLITVLFMSILFSGCGAKNEILSSLKEDLSKEEVLTLYRAPEWKIALEPDQKQPKVLMQFPFVSPLIPYNFLGKYHSDFYQNIPFEWNAVSLDSVDWSILSKDFSVYDIIYIQNISVASSGGMNEEFTLNIAKAYNVAPSNMKILKEWIQSGGVLWSESGICASRFETFYPSGGINDSKTLSLFTKDRGAFFDLPVRYRLFKGKSVDMVNYEAEHSILHGVSDVTSNIQKVIFEQKYFVESYPMIERHPLLVDTNGKVFAGYAEIGKGVVITTVPTQYWSAEDDGELYRWKLISWIMKRKGESDAAYLDKPFPKK